MGLLNAGNPLAVVPPLTFGLLHSYADLDHIILDDKQQGRVDFPDMGEVREHHERHEFQLLPIGVLVIAGFIVNDPCCHVVVIQNKQVSNTPNPHLRANPTAGL